MEAEKKKKKTNSKVENISTTDERKYAQILN